MSSVKAFPRRHLAVGLGLLALLLFPVFYTYNTYEQTVALLAFLLAIQAVSWNIISGYAGYVSLGHSVFLGLGSYTVAIIALHWGVNPLWLPPIGGLPAGGAAPAVGGGGVRPPRAAVGLISPPPPLAGPG